MVHGACQLDGRRPLVLSHAIEYRVARLAEGRHRRGSQFGQNAVDTHVLGVETRGMPRVYERQVLISVNVTCILQIVVMVGDSKSALTTQGYNFFATCPQ